MRNRAILFAAGGLVLGLLLGFGLGQMNAKTETVEKMVEVEKRVEVTPQACLEALDLAGEGFDIGADASDAASDAFTAISNFDVAGIEAATARIEEATDLMNALSSPLGEASQACRASS